ncbi:MAG: hypothetical protein ACKVJU_20760 [Verrucomicrobiales bacterium]
MSNTGKTYTEDFRRDAVELLQSSGRSATQSSARTWSQRQQLLAEIKKFERENEYLRRQREILKKCSQHPRRGPASGYALIDQMREDYPVTELCDAFNFSRRGYYNSRVQEIDPATGEYRWKQIKRNTKQTERKKAERAADEIEAATLAECGSGEDKSKKMLGVLKLATGPPQTRPDRRPDRNSLKKQISIIFTMHNKLL